MITQEIEETRRKYLGSSDMPALVGMDPWTRSSDVYLEKTGQLDPERDKSSWLIKRIGNVFETAVLDLFEEIRGVTVKRSLFLTHEMFCSNLDGFIESDNEITEAKTTGKLEEWGEQYSDDIPPRNIIQAHEQMYVYSKAFGRDCRTVWFPVLLPGYSNLEFKIFKVTRNDNLMNDIIKIGESFWNNHVIPRIPPDPFQPNLNILKRVKRIPDNIVDIDSRLVIDWKKADAIFKEADKLAKTAKERLIAALGDAEVGETLDGTRVTYYLQGRSGYTVEPTEYRVMRTKKSKSKG